MSAVNVLTFDLIRGSKTATRNGANYNSAFTVGKSTNGILRVTEPVAAKAYWFQFRFNN